VAAHFLQSGSDYADLGNALKQACSDLRGTRPKNRRGEPSASGTIRKADCKQVSKALAATELFKAPQHWPIPAEVPVCGKDKTPRSKLFERFEGAPADFKFEPSGIHWFLADHYAASNRHSVGAGDPAGPASYDTRLTQARAVRIPKGAFLRFAHFYNLRHSQAGGVVEYKVGNGKWKRVTPRMFTHNPYNLTLSVGTGNPVEGQKAFSGFSGGWTSSRINLAALTGKKVRFRFRMTTSPTGAHDSWLLDDVRIYTCAVPTLQISERP
jgi:hypothetical protein